MKIVAVRTAIKRGLLSLCLLLGSTYLTAHGDWSGFSRFGAIAELTVEDGEISLDLSFPERAATRLAHLSGLDEHRATPADIARSLIRLSTQNGTVLTARVKAVTTAGQQPAGSIPASPGTASGLSYEAIVRYPLPHPANRLTILPPEGAAANDLGLLVLHRGVPVSDLTALTQPTRVDLDWNDPWKSRFEDPGFVRRHNEPQSYLYIEPYEVRHELLVRVDELRPYFDLGLTDGRFIDETEREMLRQKLGAFLQARNPLRIDGAHASPQLDRIEFVRFGRLGVQPVAAKGRLDTKAALLGVVLVYLTEHPAHAISLRWDLFGAGRRSVSVIQGKESFDAYVTRHQPTFDWTQDEAFEPIPQPEAATDTAAAPAATPTRVMQQPDPAPIPGPARLTFASGLLVVSSLAWLRHRRRGTIWLGVAWVLAGALAFFPRIFQSPAAASLPNPEQQVNATLQPLLHNAYRAFQLRDEAAAYDRLALSLGGKLLDDVYLQQRRTILRQSEGLGGEGKVNRIEILDTKLESIQASPTTYQITSRWIAHGTVSHWGHSHDRQNIYCARLSLRIDDRGQWKIIAMNFLDGQRLTTDADA